MKIHEQIEETRSMRFVALSERWASSRVRFGGEVHHSPFNSRRPRYRKIPISAWGATAGNFFRAIPTANRTRPNGGNLAPR